MSLVLYQHPFALYCWKPLIALYERDVTFTSEIVEADRSALAALWPPASIPILVDDGFMVPESSIIVEHLDRHGDAPVGEREFAGGHRPAADSTVGRSRGRRSAPLSRAVPAAVARTRELSASAYEVGAELADKMHNGTKYVVSVTLKTPNGSTTARVSGDVAERSRTQGTDEWAARAGDRAGRHGCVSRCQLVGRVLGQLLERDRIPDGCGTALSIKSRWLCG